MGQGKKYLIIVMYTISDDTLRDTFRTELSEKYKDVLEKLNESTYAIDSVELGNVKSALAKMCKDVRVKSKKEFGRTDFVDIYCSGSLAGYTGDKDSNMRTRIIRYSIV